MFEQRRKGEQNPSIPNNERNNSAVNHDRHRSAEQQQRISEAFQRSEAIALHQRRQNIAKTNDWAETILKDLDNLILSDQRYGNATATERADSPMSPNHKRTTIINMVLRKTTPTTSPTTSPITSSAPKMTKLWDANDGMAVSNGMIDSTALPTIQSDKHRIHKPEKHVSSFSPHGHTTQIRVDLSK